MSKRKATMNSELSPHSSKKTRINSSSKLDRVKLLDGSSSEDDSDGGVKFQESSLAINENFAKKYEYNKKREELQKLEEKLSKSQKNSNKKYGDKYDDDSESSNDEEEDDFGFLATEALDAEISATLQAIRSKDPVVYNENFSFYRQTEESLTKNGEDEPKKSKPMYLRDYHREILLKEKINEDEKENDNSIPQTFAQKQEDLQNSIIKEIHATGDVESEDDGNFLVPKTKPKQELKTGAPQDSLIGDVIDVSTADKDPEKFLSNFMAARAWIPNDQSRFQPFESDDESEEERAEIFESAYNLRFEDPTGSNEALKSYSRKIVASKSVRREDKNSRKRQRDAIREKKEQEQKQLEEERNRLKRLKAEEMEERVKIIKKVAGIRGKMLTQDEIFKCLDEAWDNEKWTGEMGKLFGEEYYAAHEIESDHDSKEDINIRKKIKKPKWDDDIDISDILPSFTPQIVDQSHVDFSESDEGAHITEDKLNKSTKKDKIKAKNDEKNKARLERKRIEELVESHLDLNLVTDSKKRSRFRYRETSPVSFGLTPQDILMAPDTSLNQFAGLKKLASFRDPLKKRKDKKTLSKKSRLRQWRKETFGDENGSQLVTTSNSNDKDDSNDPRIVEGGRKKKSRSRKKSKMTDQDNIPSG